MKDDVFWSGTERRRGRQRKGSVDVKVVDTQGQAFTVCRREMEETKDESCMINISPFVLQLDI